MHQHRASAAHCEHTVRRRALSLLSQRTFDSFSPVLTRKPLDWQQQELGAAHTGARGGGSDGQVPGIAPVPAEPVSLWPVCEHGVAV